MPKDMEQWSFILAQGTAGGGSHASDMVSGGLCRFAPFQPVCNQTRTSGREKRIPETFYGGIMGDGRYLCRRSAESGDAALAGFDVSDPPRRHVVSASRRAAESQDVLRIQRLLGGAFVFGPLVIPGRIVFDVRDLHHYRGRLGRMFFVCQPDPAVAGIRPVASRFYLGGGRYRGVDPGLLLPRSPATLA